MYKKDGKRIWTDAEKAYFRWRDMREKQIMYILSHATKYSPKLEQLWDELSHLRKGRYTKRKLRPRI